MGLSSFVLCIQNFTQTAQNSQSFACHKELYCIVDTRCCCPAAPATTIAHSHTSATSSLLQTAAFCLRSAHLIRLIMLCGRITPESACLHLGTWVITLQQDVSDQLKYMEEHFTQHSHAMPAKSSSTDTNACTTTSKTALMCAQICLYMQLRNMLQLGSVCTLTMVSCMSADIGFDILV